VLATGVIGGAYMLFIAFFAMVFGTIVDRHRKHTVMVLSSVVSAAAFLVAGGIYLARGSLAAGSRRTLVLAVLGGDPVRGSDRAAAATSRSPPR
jgi:hypothetical protein